MNLLKKELVCTLLFMGVIGSFQQTTSTSQYFSVVVIDSTIASLASNIVCKLFGNAAAPNEVENFVLLATGVTDSTGKIPQFYPMANYTRGRYRVLFQIGDYYQVTQGISPFFPQLQITYENTDGTISIIPVVISPNVVNTYKGSSGVSNTLTSTTTTTKAPSTGLLGGLLDALSHLLG